MKISLAAARVNSKLTLKEAATKIGVSDRTVWMWEKGKSYPDAKQIRAIEKAYSVRYEDINFI